MRLELLLMTLSVLCAPIAALGMLPEDRPGLYLVVVPPWRAADQVIVAAGAHPVGPVRAPLGEFAAADAPGTLARLRAAGAWVVLDAKKMAWLCGAAEI